MHEQIVKMIKVFNYNYGLEPNAIYVGRNEWSDILKSNEGIVCIDEFENLPVKYCGIDLIEVDKESYLKVGYVE